ncbi:MAG: B12-binding domain-containing radical SAM protein, partial [Candidatus Omnitrophota bacterium]|nr:B12-binding domain-containing radical SAM protein [Candidatus Omnitrophota bacterium]
KNIDIEKLAETLRESYRSGWRRVKLYFMIGLPTEKEDDLKKIAKLLYEVSNLRREIDGKDANVTASINAFVPKPHTPFQREAMESVDSLLSKKIFLKDNVRSRMIELDFNSFHMGYLEAVFARGDRRLSGVLYEAYSRGAKFDGWKDHFNFNLWMESFKAVEVDPNFYASRRRGPDEILPWDFIEIGSGAPPYVDKIASV